MRISELTAHSFRNLSPDPVFFPGGVTLIAGENAQGKTNLLEAVALLCGQRSFRRARPAEMAADGQSFQIRGRVESSGRSEALAIDWSPALGTRFSRGEKGASFREASRLAPTVFLAQEHRELLTGPPQRRRRFLDRLVLASRPAAGDDLMRFERALRERNALLASLRAEPTAEGELEVWTEELVLAGSAVRRHRRAALAEWMRFFAPLARAAGAKYAAISVDYSSDEDAEEQLRAACSRLLSIERRRGHTLAGPHRDDLLWRRRGRPLVAQASAGEIHRVVALAKLAEAQAVERAAGEAPLLGVDDFDAGLSGGWVEAFLEALPRGGNVLLTTASDPARWKRWTQAVLEIRDGCVVGRLRAVND